MGSPVSSFYWLCWVGLVCGKGMLKIDYPTTVCVCLAAPCITAQGSLSFDTESCVGVVMISMSLGVRLPASLLTTRGLVIFSESGM
jgi:hypothetical protein